MQSVFNVLFIWLLFINRTVNTATLWPGLFAQTVLRTPPIYWPPTHYQNAPAELVGVNLQQSESSGHLLGSAEQHHMISSDEPIPSGLFIPVDQFHRELFNSPHLLRKHSSNHYPSYHQFNLNPHFNPHPSNKKLHSLSKHHHHHKIYPSSSSKLKSFNKNFPNRKRPYKEELNEKFSYLDEDFYAKHSDLFNFNKLSGHLLSDYVDYNSELDLNAKNWQHKFKQQQQQPQQPQQQPQPPQQNSNDQDQTNTALVNTTDEHLDQQEDDLFTIKNSNSDEQQQIQKQQQHKNTNNGRIDLRKSNKRKLLNDHLKELKDYRDSKNMKDFHEIEEIKDERELNDMNDMNGLKEMRDSKELKEFKDLNEPKDLNKQPDEKRYIENYDNRNNQFSEVAGSSQSNDHNREKFTENRNIERYNLEKFFNQNEKLAKELSKELTKELIRNDGRILINSNNNHPLNRQEKISSSVFNNFKNPSDGELSVISETIYQNHQIKNDNRRSPLILMQNYDHHHPFEIDVADKKQTNHKNETITILANNLSFNETDQSTEHTLSTNKNDHLTKLTAANSNKMDTLNEEQLNHQIFGTTWNPTTWNSQRIIPTPQINYIPSMFTESNTISTNDQQPTKSTTYQSERSQLNKNTNHFSSWAISAIIIASLIAALLFTGSSLFLMYKVSQIKKRRLMRFQETANRNQFEAVFPFQSTSCQSVAQRSSIKSLDNSSNSMGNNIISNNNFIRQQKSLFSNLNSRCNASKTILSIKDQIDPNFTIKPNKTATINKKSGKSTDFQKNLNNGNLNNKMANMNLNGGECFVTQIKTLSDQKNSALSRLISRMSNQLDEETSTNSSKSNKTNQTDPNLAPIPPKNLNQLNSAQRVSFF